MAGSQLKELKAALKSNGLIGQTNIKKRNKKSKTPSETRRQDRDKIIGNIRNEFNQFDQRVNRTKHDVTTIQGGKFVKVGSKQHNDTSRSKAEIQRAMRAAYESEKSKANSAGGLVDRRFGERNQDLTPEERMLERFTRERQASSKKSAFSLASDDEDEFDEDDGGFTLTHAGEELDLPNDDEGLGEGVVASDQEPLRKKSKNEVMKEIIAKSKFYKQQRQAEFQKTQAQIDDLDDDFGDVMTEINQVGKPPSKFSSKTQEQIDYDSKVRELAYDRRSVPSERTKTDEEITKEWEDRQKKLEADRENRMKGLESREAEADDLEDFWVGSDEDDNEQINSSPKSGDEKEVGNDTDSEQISDDSRFKKVVLPTLPLTQEALLDYFSSVVDDDKANSIKRLLDSHKPHLAPGNKEKMDLFVGVLLEYILHLSGQPSVNSELIEQLIKILKTTSESYNKSLVEKARDIINEVESRATTSQFAKEDLVFFTIIGYLFSTSDHYHLVVTPTTLLMTKYLSSFQTEKATIPRLGQGIYISELLLNYQRYSKRFIPEVLSFLEKSLFTLTPEPEKMSDLYLSNSNFKKSALHLSKKEKWDIEDDLRIGDLFSVDSSEIKVKLLRRTLRIIDKLVDLWRDKSSLVEVIDTFISPLKHLMKYTTAPASLLTKLDKLRTNAANHRTPLTLQHHRALAIATFAPKFEENFNPDKKSYDVNRERQELNKIKNEIKKEKKSALKDIRNQSKFIAREQIGEKKKMYSDYHKKMASIVNSISTVEGAAKNQYDKEKKRRKQ
ncbi:uncharacterized protein PRCAT00005381001 [Priceomyces carsonii]|uniref:uncharacterized protein n=1 Tax=Priceomyces carsonii TaxID=28549 RepID=UPI002ED8BFF8|nr:unnamed protein product [Priceomyces carsonii]